MAKPKINLRLRVIGVLLAVLTGVAVIAASAATTDWTWTTTASLPSPTRGYHTATPVPLSGGGSCVLVVGGMTMDGRYDCITSSQLYLGAQKGWAPGPSLKLPRYAHTATWLTTGPDMDRVLVAGGYQIVETGEGKRDKSLTGCELLDPTQNQGTGTPTGDLKEACTAHTATRFTSGLKAGQVLVAGGEQMAPPSPPQLRQLTKTSTPANFTTARSGTSPRG